MQEKLDPRFVLHHKNFSFMNYTDADWEKILSGNVESLLVPTLEVYRKATIYSIAISEGHFHYFKKLKPKEKVFAFEIAVKLNKEKTVEYLLMVMPKNVTGIKSSRNGCFKAAFTNQFWKIATLLWKFYQKDIYPQLIQEAFLKALAGENFDFLELLVATSSLYEDAHVAVLKAMNALFENLKNPLLDHGGETGLQKQTTKANRLLKLAHLCLKTPQTARVLEVALSHDFFLLVEIYLPKCLPMLTKEDKKSLQDMAFFKGAPASKISTYLRDDPAEISAALSLQSMYQLHTCSNRNAKPPLEKSSLTKIKKRTP